MKYDVYGIGNALVDKEFEIEDDFLKEFSIEKGMMTLVDREQQDQLLSELTRRYDVKTRSGGGSAANTLYAISQFGGSTFYSCRVANDETGDFFLQQLGDHNIQTNKNSQRVEGVSGSGRSCHVVDIFVVGQDGTSRIPANDAPWRNVPLSQLEKIEKAEKTIVHVADGDGWDEDDVADGSVSDVDLDDNNDGGSDGDGGTANDG